MIITITVFVCALSLYANTSERKFFFDEARVLDAESYVSIEKQAQDIFNSYKVGVYIVIVAEMSVKDERYIDDYVREFANQFIKDRAINRDSVLLFICVEKDNTWREAMAFGSISKNLTSIRLRNIQNAITHMLTAGQYYNAISTYCNLIKSHFIINGK